MKEVIRDQSKNCYQKDQFWRENAREVGHIRNGENGTDKENRTGIIRVASKTNVRNNSQSHIPKIPHSKT